MGDEFDHHHIYLKVERGLNESGSPFKFNVAWLNDESFHNFAVENWIPYNTNREGSVAVQFMGNLKRVKMAMVEWSSLKVKREEEVLKEV